MSYFKSITKNAKHLGNIVAKTTVWNFHNADHLCNLCNKKGTNLYKTVEDMKKRGLKGEFTLCVVRIGRSQHSASDVYIVEGLTNYEEIGSEYYSKRIDQLFLR